MLVPSLLPDGLGPELLAEARQRAQAQAGIDTQGRLRGGCDVACAFLQSRFPSWRIVDGVCLWPDGLHRPNAQRVYDTNDVLSLVDAVLSGQASADTIQHLYGVEVEGHVWLVATGGTIVDPTAEQFGGNLGTVIVPAYSENYWMWVPYS